MASDINALFPDKVCINLDRRPDRWLRVSARFGQHDVRDVRRFPAVDGSARPAPPGWSHGAGAFGCLLSHLAVVEDARRRRLPSLLVFEDDVVFAADFGARFARSASSLPDDWDMLFLGGSHRRQPHPIAGELARLAGTLATHAYALRLPVYEAFLELNGRRDDAVDVNNVRLQDAFRCYGFFPNLAWQEPGYSDVADAVVDPWVLKESLVVDADRAAAMLRETAVVLIHRSDPATRDAAGRVLAFLVRGYMQLVPASAITVVVVDDGSGATVAGLPPGCERLSVPPRAGRDEWRDGVVRTDPAKRYVVVGRGDTYIRPGEVRAALLMCPRYDLVNLASSVRGLDAGETARLIDSEGAWPGRDQPGTTTIPGPSPDCWVAARAAACSAAAWPAPRLRVFAPPFTAFRLQH